MACEHRRLDRRQRPPAHLSIGNAMIYLRFLMVFPRLDQARSSLVAQVDPTPWHPHETVRSYLPTAHQGHDEPVWPDSRGRRNTSSLV